ncbi:Alkylphosphonate ABC transporter, permease protein [Mycoplasmopsis bovigenitalium 51080]|uniref:Alkylphosphonate ABC transporter, permease protein n=1 Tax=Mycoplasmopsis bovigenitalium 51080 TaxID=1188235 RepID=N9VBX7_9BACT|nr:ABC transporter permease subunit [Mycoplasmopsis bovigenitalium]ENY68931.1 Alkylphosphonate ABC transporter, permease protein [Mycoplasmopsis bovigenitalium 51080]
MTTKTSCENRKINKESNFFRYRYINKNGVATSWKIRPIYWHIISILLISLIFIALYNSWSSIRIENIKNVARKFQNLFIFSNKSTRLTNSLTNEYTNLFLDTIKSLWITIKVAIAGTFIGFIFALITAYGSFSKHNNKYFSFFLGVLMLVLRAFPELVFINVITKVFRNELSLLAVYIWFTWLWLHKYYLDMLNSFDLEPYYIAINQGQSKHRAFINEVIPRIKNRLIALFLYSFESNIRWASLLSALSLPGIGILINYAAKTTNFYSQLGIPMTLLILFVLLLELSNYLIKKYLLETSSRQIKFNSKYKFEIYTKLAKTINIRKIFNNLLILFFAIMSIFTLATTKIWLFDLSATKTFIKVLFKPDFSHFNFRNLDPRLNPVLLVWNSLQFTIAALSICIIFTMIFLRIQPLNINRKPVSIISKSIIIICRQIPSVVLIYLFLPMFANPITIVILVIGFHEMYSKSKHLTQAIESLDSEVINNLKIAGYTNNQIFWKYVLPSIKYDFISLSMFYFELIFRNSITYSVFATGELHIGQAIETHLDLRVYEPAKAMSYIWIATFSILLINITGAIINKKIKK